MDKDELKIQLHRKKQSSYLQVSVPYSQHFVNIHAMNAKLGGRILRFETNGIWYICFLISWFITVYKQNLVIFKKNGCIIVKFYLKVFDKFQYKNSKLKIDFG